MNRTLTGGDGSTLTVPRMRGDEPAGEGIKAGEGICSPHARG